MTYRHKQLFVTVLFTILLALTCWSPSHAGATIDTNLPPTMPSPNAFNFYIQAGEALVDVDKIARAAMDRHDVKKIPTNAPTPYRALHKALLSIKSPDNSVKLIFQTYVELGLA